MTTTTQRPSVPFRSLTISADEGTATMSQDDGRYRYVYVVTIRSDGTHLRRSFKFHDSIANHEAGKRGLAGDDLYWAFRCFVDDASAGQLSFAEFCDNHGYNSDSLTAHRTWEECKRATVKYRDLWHSNVDPSDVLTELSGMGIE